MSNCMGTKMKGLFKGFKCISQFFVLYKEQELKIGYPTDVKHVAHIGWDNNSSVNSPNWMDDFRTASDFSSNSLTNFGQSRETSWASEDFDQPRGLPLHSEIFVDPHCLDTLNAPKKRQKKNKNKNKTTSPSRSINRTKITCHEDIYKD